MFWCVEFVPMPTQSKRKPHWLKIASNSPVTKGYRNLVEGQTITNSKMLYYHTFYDTHMNDQNDLMKYSLVMTSHMQPNENNHGHRSVYSIYNVTFG